jgi:hypothetical protein
MPSLVIWFGVSPTMLSAAEDDVAVVGRVQTRDHVEYGALAGAVRPDDAHDLAFFDREVETAQRVEAAEVLRDPSDVQEVHPAPSPRGEAVGAACSSAVHGSGPLVLGDVLLFQFLGSPDVRDQTLRAQDHDRHQDGPVQQQPVLLELREHPWDPDQHEGPDDHARDASHAPQDHDGERGDRHEEHEARVVQRADLHGEERPAEGPDRPAHREREELIPDGAHAHRLGNLLVLPASRSMLDRQRESERRHEM